MNVPAVAQRSFEESREDPSQIKIINSVISHLQKLSDFKSRLKFIFSQIDDYSQIVFSHPLVKKLSPCTIGCSACCHTQVSVTSDEASLLVENIQNGLSINLPRLALQASAKNDPEVFFKLSYEDRKCVFLDENGACKVYKDRPSVCRTNAVLGEAEQCSTKTSVKPLRLVKTPQSDMVIYAAFLNSPENGSLPYMVSKLLNPRKEGA